MQRIILPPVLKLVSDTPTHLHPVLRRDREIAPIKEGVEVLTQKDAVLRRVGAALREGPDVGGLQYVQDRRTGDSTPPVVSIGDAITRKAPCPSRGRTTWGWP